ncbi:hypothetical protein KM043_009593 [Ampulex compressa]|nr:hypothetical protein KM043_009593 [Ampulex compressa]
MIPDRCYTRVIRGRAIEAARSRGPWYSEEESKVGQGEGGRRGEVERGAFRKRGIQRAPVEKVVGWAWPVAISDGVTSRREGSQWRARYNEPPTCRREKVGRCHSRTIASSALARPVEEGGEEKRRSGRDGKERDKGW